MIRNVTRVVLPKARDFSSSMLMDTMAGMEVFSVGSTATAGERPQGEQPISPTASTHQNAFTRG
jgi:hypothetical protein